MTLVRDESDVAGSRLRLVVVDVSCRVPSVFDSATVGLASSVAEAVELISDSLVSIADSRVLVTLDAVRSNVIDGSDPVSEAVMERDTTLEVSNSSLSALASLEKVPVSLADTRKLVASDSSEDDVRDAPDLLGESTTGHFERLTNLT